MDSGIFQEYRKESTTEYICSYIIIISSSYNRASLWDNPSSGFPTRSQTNRAVQSQKMARGLKFCI